MRNYCTYFDRNYLARALALLESLDKHETTDFRLFVVCLDEVTRLLLGKLNHPRLIPIARHEVERHDPALVAPRSERSLAEYYYTLTPTVIRRILDLLPADETLVYLDADLYFFSDPGSMLKELDGNSILIHEHRYSPQLAYLEHISGRFNVGLLGFRNDSRGQEVLNWWRARCNEWCYARTEDGKMGDQMYLDDWPERFGGVRILEDPGGGVAPWNQAHLDFTEEGGILKVQGHPIVFFHFHAVIPLNRQVYLLAKHATYALPLLSVMSAYAPYVVCLERWNDWIRSQMPAAGFGYWPDQTLFPGAALLLTKQAAANLPLRSIPLNEGWALVPGTQVRMAATTA